MKKLLTTAAIILVLAATQFAQAEDNKGEGCPKWREHKEEILSALPEEKRELFRTTMRSAREKNKESWEKIRTLRKESKAILTAPEFDRKTFLAKSNEIHALHDTMRQTMNNAIADVAEKFTAEERQILVKVMPKGQKHGYHKHKGLDRDEKEDGE